MRITKRQPVTVGDILRDEFLEPMNITHEALAVAMGVHCDIVKNLLNGAPLSIANAVKLASVFGNSPDFWLNIQQADDSWKTRHDLNQP